MSKEEMNLGDFADQLIKEKDFSDVTDAEVLTQIKEDLLGSIEETINAMIISELPTEKIEELSRLSDDANDEELAKFISDNIPNLQEKILQTLTLFRSSYLGK